MYTHNWSRDTTGKQEQKENKKTHALSPARRQRGAAESDVVMCLTRDSHVLEPSVHRGRVTAIKTGDRPIFPHEKLATSWLATAGDRLKIFSLKKNVELCHRALVIVKQAEK